VTSVPVEGTQTMTSTENGNVWTVEVHPQRDEGGVFGEWSEWTTWVDRATAEAERQHAIDEGYMARIVRSS
jgi:hypothetical protein